MFCLVFDKIHWPHWEKLFSCKIELFLNSRLPVQLFRGERRSLAEVLGRAGHQGQVAGIRPPTRPPWSAGGITEEGENSSVVGCNCSQGFGSALIDPDPNPTFFLIADPDPDLGFDDLKLKKIYSWKFNIFFIRRLSNRRSLQLWKENIQYFRTWKLCTFSIFVGNFCPPGSGSSNSN